MNTKKLLLQRLRPSPCDKCGAAPQVIKRPWPNTCIDVECPNGCCIASYMGTERHLAIRCWNTMQKRKINTCP